MRRLKRRDFLKLLGGATLTSFVVPEELLSKEESEFNDFKALVVVDFQGGNDAFNMFIPSDTKIGVKTGYEYYRAARSNKVRVKDNNLMLSLRKKIDGSGYLALSGASSNPYFLNSYKTEDSYTKGFYLLDKRSFDSKIAVNPLMPEVAYWLDRGKGAIIHNLGSIPAPATKSDLKSGKVSPPPFLFAHNQQAILAQTGQASSITIPTGWLGRVADKWKALYSNSVYRMNINLSSFGQYKMFFGNHTTPMSYDENGPLNYHPDSSNFRRELAQISGNGMFNSLHKETQESIISQVQETVNDWEGLSGIFSGLTDSYGKPFLANSGRATLPSRDILGVDIDINSSQIEPFMTAAKLIQIIKNRGHKRVVISIVLGGFDQHSTQARDHSQRIRGFSLGLDRFLRVIERQNLLNSVTLFTVSEFARSLGDNGDGTDHAWGGSYSVFGGAVKSGNYGQFADLTLGGDEDYTNKGRFIPSTSFTQYYATLLKWFGADDEVMNYALPELKNFDNKDLGFLG